MSKADNKISEMLLSSNNHSISGKGLNSFPHIPTFIVASHNDFISIYTKSLGVLGGFLIITSDSPKYSMLTTDNEIEHCLYWFMDLPFPSYRPFLIPLQQMVS